MSTSDIRVLHVDDQVDMTELVKIYLEREDPQISVECSTDPTEALGIIRNNSIDCVVSDYDMPQLDGIELLRSVREEGNDVPFILFTGKGSEEVAGEAISAGVTDYLQKGGQSSRYTVLANRIANSVEQYRARKRVEKAEEKLSLIAEKSDDILFMFSGDWSELLFINSAYERIYGGSIEKLREQPKSFLEQIHPNDQEKARQSMEKLAEGEKDSIEYRVILPNGEERIIHGETEPVFDEDGNVDRVVGFVRDITKYQ